MMSRFNWFYSRLQVLLDFIHFYFIKTMVAMIKEMNSY